MTEKQYQNERKAEAQKIAAILTGTYDWQGCKETLGTPELYDLVKSALRKSSTGVVEEYKVGDNEATYRPTSKEQQKHIGHYDWREDEIIK